MSNPKGYRGTSLIRNSPPHQVRLRALGIFLLEGPGGALFLMIEVPLYESHDKPTSLLDLRMALRIAGGFLWLMPGWVKCVTAVGVTRCT